MPHRKCGKLVVATNEAELARLDAVYKQSQINGCEGVELIDRAAAKRVFEAMMKMGKIDIATIEAARRG